MIVSQIAAQSDFLSYRKIKARSIEETSGKLFIPSYVMCPYTQHGISVMIEETDCQIRFAVRSAVSEHLNACPRIYIDQADLDRCRIFTVIDQTYLHAANVTSAKIQ